MCVFVGVFLSGFLSFQKKPVYYLGALPFFLLNILIRSSPACSRKKNPEHDCEVLLTSSALEQLTKQV